MMGIQSTRYITRERAEEMFIEQYTIRNQDRLEREAKVLTNKELEDVLEATFDNYIITEDKSDSLGF